MDNKTTAARSEAVRRPGVMNENQEIDLLEVFFVLKDNFVLLLAAILAGAIVMWGYTQYFITPTYAATSSIYIISSSSALSEFASTLTSSDLSIGSQVIDDVQYFATTHEVAEKIAEKLDLDMSQGQLLSHYSITKNGNRIIMITARHSDPEMAALLSNTMANTLREFVIEKVDIGKPSLLSTALIPSSPVGPNVSRNTMMGGAAAGGAVAAVLILLYLMDDTVKTEEDINKRLHVKTLAVLPLEHREKAKT